MPRSNDRALGSDPAHHDSGPTRDQAAHAVDADLRDDLGNLQEVAGTMGTEPDRADDPDAAVFDNSGADESITETMKDDADKVRRYYHGDPIDVRDLSVVLATWILGIGAVLIAGELLIDHFGEGAGLLWDLRVAAGLYARDAVNTGGHAVDYFLENNLAALGIVALTFLLIYRGRRW